jgi:hypothetical protein
MAGSVSVWTRSASSQAVLYCAGVEKVTRRRRPQESPRELRSWKDWGNSNVNSAAQAGLAGLSSSAVQKSPAALARANLACRPGGMSGTRASSREGGAGIAAFLIGIGVLRRGHAESFYPHYRHIHATVNSCYPGSLGNSWSWVRPLFPRWNGRKINPIGDAFLMEFRSAWKPLAFAGRAAHRCAHGR